MGPHSLLRNYRQRVGNPTHIAGRGAGSNSVEDEHRRAPLEVSEQGVAQSAAIQELQVGSIRMPLLQLLEQLEPDPVVPEKQVAEAEHEDGRRQFSHPSHPR